MSQQRVLVIDDEENMRHMLKTILKKEAYAVETASDGLEALEQMQHSDFNYILCDIRMPRMDGISFLKEAKEKYPDKTIIMMSAYGSIETALEAMKDGAYDYISKPFKADEVLLTLKKAEERERLKEENLELRTRISEVENKYSFQNIVARSEVMARVFDIVNKVSQHKTTILITGESGTGKELIAKAIHSSGSRSSRPLVTINCGGIPDNLLESELFGYKKGAFTDAFKDKPGRFEEADGGTILLDEIGEMPLVLQVKLLRFLQEEEIMPLGGVGSKRIDVRVLASTSKDLEKEVSHGRFREDLFYRINVMPIHLPPLRARRGDIPLLAGYFLNQFNNKLKKNIEGLSSQTMSILMEYKWPGNVRELENVMERAALLTAGRWVTPADLPPNLAQMKKSSLYLNPEDGLSIKEASKRLHRHLIEEALRRTGGNRTKAAELLEISRPMLIAKIREYSLEA